ncbi:hypothetical protein [Candidatus Coxiella mudrowiae]|uniref:Uncharacterized protein n=1 Tax=Candidatus Coxiella mudrowiae TaxID=2054173 RepID=A0ABN4HQR4_9COXI|nr:hypothetical protein [Candidatus Coxiella mudrowiae]AKQ33159.1 hypothetical protein CleRT_00420 [Candidatus Coxiella mudrowiae]
MCRLLPALPTEVFLAFINKISTVILDAALILRANDGRISLMTAAISQSETGFMVLIDKATSSAINKTLNLIARQWMDPFICYMLLPATNQNKVLPIL